MVKLDEIYKVDQQFMGFLCFLLFKVEMECLIFRVNYIFLGDGGRVESLKVKYVG